MKNAIVVLAVMIVTCTGCSGKQPNKKGQPIKTEWVDEPFKRVKITEEFFNSYAEVWLECQTGDVVKADYKYRGALLPELKCVYLVRKDATRVGLPTFVHQPVTKDVYRIERYHLTINGREVNFFDP
jgi:hypothetical protein